MSLYVMVMWSYHNLSQLPEEVILHLSTDMVYACLVLFCQTALSVMFARVMPQQKV